MKISTEFVLHIIDELKGAERYKGSEIDV